METIVQQKNYIFSTYFQFRSLVYFWSYPLCYATFHSPQHPPHLFLTFDIISRWSNKINSKLTKISVSKAKEYEPYCQFILISITRGIDGHFFDLLLFYNNYSM